MATDVKGEAAAGYVLGVSGTRYRRLQTAAVARVTGDGMLYSQALSNLWENVREQYGEVEGEELALTNLRYDTEALNLLVYTKPRVSVRADVVEFTE